MSRPASIPALNFARWSMAGLVVIGHARDLIFRDAPQMVMLGMPWKVFYFMTGFGHAAVVVFFVLSGFFVGGKLIETPDLDAAVIRRYLVDRFSRIYIVLAPALMLTVLLDTTGAILSPIYGGYGWSTSLPTPVTAALNAENFFTSLFNVTMYVGAPLGSDGPLWSLAFEWTIYLFFPYLLRDAQTLRAGRLRLGTILRIAIGVLLIVASPALGLWLVIWLFGVSARWRVDQRRDQGRAATIVILFGILAVMFTVARLTLLPSWVADLALGLAAAALCAQPRIIGWNHAPTAHEIMAGFSFSLYVIHYPILLFGVAWLQYYGRLVERLAPGGEALGLFLGLGLAVYAAAWLFSRLTEAQTHRFRRTLLSLLAALKTPKSV